jgi:prevent-host-death family protein
MVQFDIHEAESEFSKLLDLALEGEEVVISRDGTPVAKLTPVRSETGDRPLECGAGTVHT